MSGWHLLPDVDDEEQMQPGAMAGIRHGQNIFHRQARPSAATRNAEKSNPLPREILIALPAKPFSFYTWSERPRS